MAHPIDYETLLAAVTRDIDLSSARSIAPILAIDKCANHPTVRVAQTEAVRQGLVNRVVDLWLQLRKTEDGGTSMWMGQIHRTALPPSTDVGKPVKGFSWPDEYVAQLLVAQLCASDKVVLVSENTKNDQGGLRRILQSQVAPQLSQGRYGQLGIAAFMKKGRTSWQDYASQLLCFLQSGEQQPGFHYIEV